MPVMVHGGCINGMATCPATINGTSIMNKLTEVGGYYTIYPVTQDVEARAYFEPTEEKEEIERPKDFEYAVNAGDIDPKTLSTGDSFGVRNSVTDQFYAADAKTGKSWGFVDDPAQNSSHPNWLIGKKTWPYEGGTDSLSKEASFRYLKDIPVSDPGIIYQFELEPNEKHDVEM